MEQLKQAKTECHEKANEVETMKQKLKFKLDSSSESSSSHATEKLKHEKEKYDKMEQLYKQEAQVLNEQLANLKEEHE